jgi:hypothetical protein
VARSFDKNEIVEVSPLHVPLLLKMPALKNSALDDYFFSSDYYDGHGKIQKAAFPTLGYIMVNNHHPNPNVSFDWVGRPPHPDDTNQKLFYIILKASFQIMADLTVVKPGSNDVACHSLSGLLKSPNWRWARSSTRPWSSTAQNSTVDQAVHHGKRYVCKQFCFCDRRPSVTELFQKHIF